MLACAASRKITETCSGMKFRCNFCLMVSVTLRRLTSWTEASGTFSLRSARGMVFLKVAMKKGLKALAWMWNLVVRPSRRIYDINWLMIYKISVRLDIVFTYRLTWHVIRLFQNSFLLHLLQRFPDGGPRVTSAKKKNACNHAHEFTYLFVTGNYKVICFL